MRLLLYITVFISFNSKSTAQRLNKAASPFVQGYFTAGTAKIYYETYGKGPDVVLVHAGMMDHKMWNDQVIFLSAHYRVITFDLPAHGRSVSGDSSISANTIFFRLLSTLNIKKARFVGLSLGAVCVTDFMVEHPERIDKVILVSPGLNGSEKYMNIDSLSAKWFTDYSGALEKKDTVEAAKVFMRYWSTGIFRKETEVRASVNNYVYNTALKNLYKHHSKGFPAFEEPPAIQKLDSVKLPVLIIDGDKDLPYIIQASEYLHSHLTKSKLSTINNVAHMINLEKPDVLNKAIMAFLKE